MGPLPLDYRFPETSFSKQFYDSRPPQQKRNKRRPGIRAATGTGTLTAAGGEYAPGIGADALSGSCGSITLCHAGRLVVQNGAGSCAIGDPVTLVDEATGTVTVLSGTTLLDMQEKEGYCVIAENIVVQGGNLHCSSATTPIYPIAHSRNGRALAMLVLRELPDGTSFKNAVFGFMGSGTYTLTDATEAFLAMGVTPDTWYSVEGVSATGPGDTVRTLFFPADKLSDGAEVKVTATKNGAPVLLTGTAQYIGEGTYGVAMSEPVPAEPSPVIVLGPGSDFNNAPPVRLRENAGGETQYSLNNGRS